MLQELAVDKANSQNVFSCISVDFLQFINLSLYAFFKNVWSILNIVFNRGLLFCVFNNCYMIH